MLLLFCNYLYNIDLFNLYFFMQHWYSKIFGGKKVRVVVEPQMELGAVLFCKSVVTLNSGAQCFKTFV